MATTYSTLGEVYTAMEFYSEALKCYDTALQLFEAEEDLEWMAVLYRELAFTKRRLGCLDDAWKDIEVAHKLCVQHGITKEFPAILHQMGHISWDLGRLDDAEEYFQDSYEASKKRQDSYCLVDNLVALAELDYVRRKHATRILGYATEAEKQALQYGYWDQLARLRVVQGNLSADETSGLADGDERRGGLLEEAFVRYSEAMLYALRFNRYLLDETVEKIVEKAKEVAGKGQGEAARTLIEQLIEFWQTGTLDGKPLVETEREGRDREKGDGRPQTMVVERLRQAMKTLADAKEAR